MRTNGIHYSAPFSSPWLDRLVVLGLVTAGGVAIASFHDGVFPRSLGWVSAVATGLFTVLTFLPFLSWVPAMLWLLVAGVGLLAHERRHGAAAAPAQV
jgi:hypothetical protein